MKKISSIVAVAMLSVTCLPGARAVAKDSRAEVCNRLWLDESGPFVYRETPDYAGLLAWWRSQEKKCAGTVTYEAHLAYIHLYLRRYDETRRILDGIKNRKSSYNSMVELIRVSADLAQIESLPEDQRYAAFFKGLAALKDYTERYPDKGEGFAMLGSMLLFQHDYDGSLKALESALRVLAPDQSKIGIYRDLAVVKAHLGQYAEAVAAADEALTYTTSFRGDTEFMSAMVRAHAGLGHFDQVDAVIEELTRRRPAARDDADFKEAVAFAQARRQATP